MKSSLVISFFYILAIGTSCRNQIEDYPANFDYNQPNILWLVTEDLSPVIPAYGDSTIALPNLDWLASEGVIYDNFFTPHPVCGPARASIITGMYANHIGASHMRTGPWFREEVDQELIDWYKKANETEVVYEALPPPEVKMFTEYLRSAGYYCSNNSKMDYQMIPTITAWDDNGKNAHWRNRKSGQPFFSVFNFEVTHESKIWTKAGDSLWVDENLDVPVPPYLPDTDLVKQDIRRMYSNIKEMDSQIGVVLEQLKKDGLLENTIIIWYSDHGGPMPRQKRSLYDSGIKVPMIIRFPGKRIVKRDQRLISFIDLAPTMLSLAGIEPPDHLEGKAFIGEFNRKKPVNYVFGASDRYDEVADRRRCVRDQQFKYIRYYMNENPMALNISFRNQMETMQELKRLDSLGLLNGQQKLWLREYQPKQELFDLSVDPYELKDVSDDPRYVETKKRLKSVLDNWIKISDDTGMQEESLLLKDIMPNGKQPVTATPKIELSGDRISLSCATPGASIGYKLVHDGSLDKELPWKIYDQSFPIESSCTLLVQAHRLGFKRSEILMQELTLERRE